MMNASGGDNATGRHLDTVKRAYGRREVVTIGQKDADYIQPIVSAPQVACRAE